MTIPDGYLPVHHVKGCNQVAFYVNPDIFRGKVICAVDIYFTEGEQPIDGGIIYLPCSSCGCLMDFSEIPDMRHLL